MCWVIPPASPAATSVVRIASSSEVLPWSTWPITVTTGGPEDEIGLVVLEGGLVVEPPRRHGRSRPSGRTPRRGRSTVSSVRVCVSVAISPCCISFLMTSALLTPNVSETSRTVAPELTLSASALVGAERLQLRRLVEGGPAATAAAARRPLRRALRHVVAAGGLRVDDDAAALLAGSVPAWAAAAGRLTGWTRRA